MPRSRRKYKDPQMQAIYDWFYDNRPDPEQQKGRGACGNAYFVGRSQPDLAREFAVRGSKAWPAWKAGVDVARELRA